MWLVRNLCRMVMKKIYLGMLAGMCISSPVFADWLPSLPSPDKWLNQQCMHRIAQYPKVKLSSSERRNTCACMTQHAKAKLSASDILNLAQMSDSELERKYGGQAKQAFDRCSKQQMASE